jgi:hypothetical protein
MGTQQVFGSLTEPFKYKRAFSNTTVAHSKCACVCYFLVLHCCFFFPFFVFKTSRYASI